MIQITEELNIKTSLMICQNVEKLKLLLADALQIGGLKNFANDTGKAPALESPFNKSASSEGGRPSKLAKPPKTSLFTEHFQ